MKKPIIIISALCASVVCFSACGNKGIDAQEYENLNNRLSASYSQITLTVTDTFRNDGSLVSSYEMSFSDEEITVNYSIEKFAEISLDGENSLKTVSEGTAVIKDGAVISGDADAVSAMLSESGLDFKAEYFSKPNLTDTVFKADVKNPSGFIGRAVIGTDMKVHAVFTADKFRDIKITYTAESGHSVEYWFHF